MNADLITYLDDGAGRSALATLAYLQYCVGDGIEESWNKEFHKYDANVNVFRWENGREQGYVVYLRFDQFLD